MTFDEALEELEKRAFVARRGWNGKYKHIGMIMLDAYTGNSLPYLWLHTAEGTRAPWILSQTDMLADDWYCVKDTNMHA
jgi:hypothetical protein